MTKMARIPHGNVIFQHFIKTILSKLVSVIDPKYLDVAISNYIKDKTYTYCPNCDFGMLEVFLKGRFPEITLENLPEVQRAITNAYTSDYDILVDGLSDRLSLIFDTLLSRVPKQTDDYVTKITSTYHLPNIEQYVPYSLRFFDWVGLQDPDMATASIERINQSQNYQYADIPDNSDIHGLLVQVETLLAENQKRDIPRDMEDVFYRIATVLEGHVKLNLPEKIKMILTESSDGTGDAPCHTVTGYEPPPVDVFDLYPYHQDIHHVLSGRSVLASRCLADLRRSYESSATRVMRATYGLTIQYETFNLLGPLLDDRAQLIKVVGEGYGDDVLNHVVTSLKRQHLIISYLIAYLAYTRHTLYKNTIIMAVRDGTIYMNGDVVDQGMLDDELVKNVNAYIYTLSQKDMEEMRHGVSVDLYNNRLETCRNNYVRDQARISSQGQDLLNANIVDALRACFNENRVDPKLQDELIFSFRNGASLDSVITRMVVEQYKDVQMTSIYMTITELLKAAVTATNINDEEDMKAIRSTAFATASLMFAEMAFSKFTA